MNSIVARHQFCHPTPLSLYTLRIAKGNVSLLLGGWLCIKFLSDLWLLWCDQKTCTHTHLFSSTNGHRVRVNPFSLSNFDANCWVRASGNFKSKRSKPKGIGLFFVKAYHHPTQKSRNQAAARCLRVQHVKNQVAARVTAHFLPLIIVIVLL